MVFDLSRRRSERGQSENFEPIGGSSGHANAVSDCQRSCNTIFIEI